MYRSTRVALGFLFVILFCTAPAAFAQGGTGQLSGNVVDANGAPTQIRGVHAELAAAATEVDEPRAVGHGRRHALDRESHALASNGEANVADVGGLHPRVGVPVEVLLDVVLHRPYSFTGRS